MEFTPSLLNFINEFENAKWLSFAIWRNAFTDFADFSLWYLFNTFSEAISNISYCEIIMYNYILIPLYTFKYVLDSIVALKFADIL